MTATMIIAAGLLVSALALTLARMEFALTGGESRVANPMGDVITIFFAWAAFAGLLTAALYRLGLVPAIALAGGPLLLGRLLPASPRLTPLFPYKLALAVAALILAILALLGVVSLIEGAFYG